ncbi:MAG TPA: VOC family protein, partial [Streptosporangiaceae bacterium]
MTVARFKDLCIDAADPAAIGPFWAKVLGLSWQMQDGGDGFLTGRTPQHTIWVNKVPEPKTVKHRVHLDIYAARLADLQELGSRTVRPEGDGRGWTVMADPEHGEYCAFLHNELPGDLLHGLVVDSVDAEAQARWWAEVYGGRLVNHSSGYSTVQDVPGMPILTMDFVPVPEPKTVKNRVHWDVTVTDPQRLIDAGATVLRKPDAEVRWHVMADPEGNEFCA